MINEFFKNDEFLIDEKVQFIKLTNEYSIYNNVGEKVGYVAQKLTTWQKIRKMLLNPAMQPFLLEIRDANGNVAVQIRRGWTFWMSKINITDGTDQPLGYFQQKFKLFKPTFLIFNSKDEKVAEITGVWKAWNFKIVSSDGSEIGTINKKWAGILKEAFTTADKYYVSVNKEYAEDNNKVVILSAAITIDMVMKESK